MNRPIASRDDRDRLFLSVVLPVYNEASALRRLSAELLPVVRSSTDRFEIIFVNDGSTDGSDAILDELACSEPGARVLHLSRNFGQQAAVHAGLEYASGNAIVVMDSDLQDDPHDIPRLLEKWRAGYDIVYAVRTSRKENWLKRALFFCFYRVFSNAADVRMPLDAGNFGLVGRRAAREVVALGDYDRYFPGLRGWVGFRQTGVEIERRARHDGTPKASLWGLLRLARTALVGHSTVPLTMFYALAGLSMILMAALTAFTLYHKFVTGLAVPGWTSHIITASFFGALNALGIAILGEYVMKIYCQVRARPIYLIARESGAGASGALKGAGVRMPGIDDREPIDAGGTSSG